MVNILDFKVESPNADYLYTGSRFALHGLTSALALDLAPKVRINSGRSRTRTYSVTSSMQNHCRRYNQRLLSDLGHLLETLQNP